MIRLNKKAQEEIGNIWIVLIFISTFLILIIVFALFDNPFARTAKPECSLEYAELSTSLNQILNSRIKINNNTMTLAEYIPSSHFYKSSLQTDEQALKIILHEKLSQNFFLQPYQNNGKGHDWKFSVIRPYKNVRSTNPGSPGWETIFQYTEVNGQPFNLVQNSIQLLPAKKGPEVFQSIPTPTGQELVVGLQVFIPNYKSCQ